MRNEFGDRAVELSWEYCSHSTLAVEQREVELVALGKFAGRTVLACFGVACQ